ncbi:MAG TPA: hypothetical protein VJ964_01855 [Balneolaceae bacterium]|nr:hypothetical protein [Balneolaceae bacterium]
MRLSKTTAVTIIGIVGLLLWAPLYAKAQTLPDTTDLLKKAGAGPDNPRNKQTKARSANSGTKETAVPTKTCELPFGKQGTRLYSRCATVQAVCSGQSGQRF